MSGFSPEWLALREPADHRSRDARVADTLRSYFLQRDSLRVVDLGCGTGSNLRATSQLLPDRQSWTLVDYDARLLAAARVELAKWADASRETPAGGLSLTHGPRTIDVAFRQADLMTDLDAVLPVAAAERPELVTASALFDLASEAFIRRFAKSVARTRAAFYTVLTYNGIQLWAPRGPLDQQLRAAFVGHQMTDKGFGVSAGPLAPEHLGSAFRAFGYLVSEGDSPWVLTAPGDAALITELATGFAAAVRETKDVSGADIDKWLARRFTGAEVGHTDTLALPGSNMISEFGED
ncbi:MAG: class I SAM-dependent methyltransferase [Hyphomicrobiaceae bacterium]|nr:class I SAM-dependent methyltransferase [Hyphomicrobiaceae bacterium]